MRTTTILAVVFAIFAGLRGASAEDGSYGRDYLIAGAEINEVLIYDQVTGGCFPDAKATRTAVELEFRRHNLFAGPPTTILNSQVEIAAVGYVTNAGCVVYVKLDVVRFYGIRKPISNSTDMTFVSIQLFEGGTLLSGPKSYMGKQIKEAALELTQDAVLDILSTRDKVFKADPGFALEAKKASEIED